VVNSKEENSLLFLPQYYKVLVAVKVNGLIKDVIPASSIWVGRYSIVIPGHVSCGSLNVCVYSSYHTGR
jgi:hypothetical protein